MGSFLVQQNNFRRSDSGVWQASESKAFHYSDGEESERYLQRVLEQSEDLSSSSVELEDQIIDWPSEYHLSFKRHNLLRFLHLQAGQRVLELGCGCGAVSRYLGEQGLLVDAVEGSAIRADLAAKRCRDLEQVNIINANYNDLQLPADHYDLVLFVGVLEYAGMFIEESGKHQQAVVAILNQSRRTLRETGVAVVAIENRLGLKYLCGAGEDHLAKPYIGVYGYPGQESIRTYSHDEWLRLIDETEFSAHEFAYCFPDYKISTTIVSDRFVRAPEFADHLLDGTHSRDYSGFLGELENEQKLVKGFYEAGQLAHFANSFLLLLGQQPGPIGATLRYDYLHSSDYSRRPEFRTLTVKHRDSDRLEKQPIFPSIEHRLLTQSYEVSAYTPGELLSNIWAQDLEIDGNFDALLGRIREYLAYLRETLGDDGDNGSRVDLLPFNIIVDTGGRLVAFDQEWHYHQKVTPGYIFFRALFYFINRYKHCFAANYGGQAQVAQIIKDIYRRLDLQSELDNWPDYIRLEDQFQKIVKPPRSLSTVAVELEQTISREKLAPTLQYHLPGQPHLPIESLATSASYGIDRQQVEFFFEFRGDKEQAVELHFAPAQHAGFFHIYRFTVDSGFDLDKPERRHFDYDGRQLAEHSRMVSLDYGHSGQQDIFVATQDDPHLYLKDTVTLRPGESVHVSVSMSWPKSRDFRVAQSSYLRENVKLRQELQSMEDELRQLRHFEAELRLVKHSRVWRTAEKLRHWLYLDTLGKYPALQKLGLGLSRRQWRKLANEDQSLNLSVTVQRDPYQSHIAHDQLTDEARAVIKKQIARFLQLPKFSIVMPVYNTPPAMLDAAVASIKRQLYENWELCLVDDASNSTATRHYLQNLNHPRISLRRNLSNRNIAESTNRAIEVASGDYIVFMDHDDVITEDALYEFARLINNHQRVDIVYSDEDFLDLSGKRINPHFKPDFSPDLLLSHNYITHLVAVKSSLVTETGPLDSQCDGAQDYDFLLRATELTDAIYHLPKVLYHWRMSSSSTSMDSGAKPEAVAAARRALSKALERRGIQGEVLNGNLPHFFRIKRRIEGEPRISIVIPFKDRPDLLKVCLDSILERSTYPNFEIIGISNNSESQETFDLMQRYCQQDNRVAFHEHNVPFNFSAIVNHGVTKARGEHLVIMNNDIEIISWDWLEAMLEHSQRPEIGAVGGKLYYADNTIQHAGIVVGIGGYAGHAHKHLPAVLKGYFNRLNVVQNISAVTGALFMVKQSLFEQLNGFDETHLKIACNDVDFCLRLMEAGYRNLFTPYAKAYHYESSSRGYEDTPEKKSRFNQEMDWFRERHGEFLASGDPHYNPNLSTSEEHFGLREIEPAGSDGSSRHDPGIQ